MKKKITQLRWLAATIMLVAAMAMPSVAWAQESTVTFTAKEGTAGFSESEKYDKLIDGKYTSEDGTKWCSLFPSAGAYIIFSASEAIQVTGYSIVTGNDNADIGNAGRNPKSWKIYGCNDESAGRSSESWVLIDQKKDYTGLEDVNYQKYDFTLSNPSLEKYQYFMMEITETKGASVLQMSELILTYATCDHQWTKTGELDPTCTEGGYDVYECSLCHETKNEPNGNVALGHEWKDGQVVNPTCTTYGYTLQTCSRCKAEQKINIVEATGHQWGTDDICDVCEAENSTPSIPKNGDGSPENPYQIGTVGELYWFVALVNGNTSVEGITSANPAAYATLTADIVVNRDLLSSLQYDESGNVSNGTIFIAWTPIGSNSNPYTGRFNGNNHTVSGLYSNYGNESNDVGLFGYNSGTIANVGVIDSYFKGGGNVGGVCGYNNSYNNMIATIENCYNTGTVSGSDGNVGGVCGYNCAIPDSETMSVSAIIKNCYNTGTVSGNGGNVGGVCGYNRAETYIETLTFGDATIENCYNTGMVSGNGGNIGGVCGKQYADMGSATIDNCYYNNDYYTGNAIGYNNSQAGNVEGKSSAQFASGEVCYLLNGNKSVGTGEKPLAWYQYLDISGNASPVLTSTGDNTVYQVNLLCGGTVTVGKKYANIDEDEILEHILPEAVTFNSEKNIYNKVCQREGCGHAINYYADAAGTIEATPYADATEFTVASYSLEDATKYDNKAVFTATKFTYTRTFSNTNWTTWYVPFDLTLTSDICAHYDFSRINNVHQYDTDNDGTADKTVVESFRQMPGVTLKANYPYLVKPVNEGDMNMVLPLEGVKPALAQTNSIDCQSVDYKYTFTGTYTAMGDGGSGYYDPYTLWTDGTWQHFHSLDPMRHYLIVTQRNSSYASAVSLRSIMLSVIGDEGTTGIVNMYSDERKAAETYDLGGRRLPAGASQKGVMIENGKVIIKK